MDTFQNRVKQAKFMDQPNQRKIRTAGAQIGVHSAPIRRSYVTNYGSWNAFTAAVFALRNTTENELRQIWGWINRPGIQESSLLSTGVV